MAKQIVIAIVSGCGLTALSLFWCHTNIDSEFRGAPFALLQTGMTLSLETMYRIHFGALLLDILVFSIPVLLLLRFLGKGNLKKQVTSMS